MKIRKVLDKKVGDKTYYRYMLVLPKDIVEGSGLLGKKLKVKKENNKLIIEK